MPLPLVPLVLGLLALATSGIVVLTFWSEIAGIMMNTVLPWLDKNVPSIAGLAREVFDWIDQRVAPLAKKVRGYWKTVRQTLIGQLVIFKRRSDNKIVQQVCTYFRKLLESGETKTIQRTEESEVDWLDVPDEIRAYYIRTGKLQHKTNTTALIDQRVQNPEQDIDREIIVQEV